MLGHPSAYYSTIVGLLLLVATRPIQAQPMQEGSVTVTFEVVVPEETPAGDTVFWAGSLNDWDPGRQATGFSARDESRPAETVDGQWQVALTAPKGEKMSYKYTRGSIFSVEERADYTYRPVRTVQFDRSKVIHDTVSAWHDRPAEPISGRWPTVDLRPSEVTLVQRGDEYDSFGTILYDEARSSKFYDLGRAAERDLQFPDRLQGPVVYYLRVAEAPPSYVIVVAGAQSRDGWSVYVDRNRNGRIEASEQAFQITHDSAEVEWTGTVALPPDARGLHPREADSVQVTLRHVPDPPGRRTSSDRADAPDLFGSLPLKHRTATLNGRSFHVSTPFPIRFTNYFRLTVDRNGDGRMDIGSGSDEVVEVNAGKMQRRQRFFIHPTFEFGGRTWEVASVNPTGTELRLRPASSQAQRAIDVGTAVPNWKATTLEGRRLSASSLKGKYVLLDFWGSWCAPCVEAIPKLKAVYDRYENQNFELVGFAAEGESSLRTAVDRYGIEWPQVVDNEVTYSSTFSVRGYPTYYLVGPSGTIVATGDRLREEGFIPVLEEYLGE
jgi:thiol-disulfide isomerase/thioredoxin